MSGSEEKSEQEHLTYDIRHSVHKTCISSTKRVTRKFLEVYVAVVQNKGKEMYKKWAARAKLLFC